MPEKRPSSFPLRWDEPETKDKLIELAKHFDRSQNKMLNIIIKEKHGEIFKSKP